VTNESLTRALGSALNRPTFFKIPSFVLKAKYGEGAQAIMEGQHVIPKRLLESGFTFKFEKIEDALEDLIT
jgi:NAD dependent epimerase/dehydratase family enzyme